MPKIQTPRQPSDYKPISALPVLSKIYEKLVLKQTVKFIENREWYEPTQSGFRKKHSTFLVKIQKRHRHCNDKGGISPPSHIYTKRSAPLIIVY